VDLHLEIQIMATCRFSVFEMKVVLFNMCVGG